jgi:hypothetical protein
MASAPRLFSVSVDTTDNTCLRTGGLVAVLTRSGCAGRPAPRCDSRDSRSVSLGFIPAARSKCIARAKDSLQGLAQTRTQEVTHVAVPAKAGFEGLNNYLFVTGAPVGCCSGRGLRGRLATDFRGSGRIRRRQDSQTRDTVAETLERRSPSFELESCRDTPMAPAASVCGARARNQLESGSAASEIPKGERGLGSVVRSTAGTPLTHRLGDENEASPRGHRVPGHPRVRSGFDTGTNEQSERCCRRSLRHEQASKRSCERQRARRGGLAVHDRRQERPRGNLPAQSQRVVEASRCPASPNRTARDSSERRASRPELQTGYALRARIAQLGLVDLGSIPSASTWGQQPNDACWDAAAMSISGPRTTGVMRAPKPGIAREYSPSRDGGERPAQFPAHGGGAHRIRESARRARSNRAVGARSADHEKSMGSPSAMAGRLSGRGVLKPGNPSAFGWFARRDLRAVDPTFVSTDNTGSDRSEEESSRTAVRRRRVAESESTPAAKPALSPLGAVAACQAHNLEVAGAIPAGATTESVPLVGGSTHGGRPISGLGESRSIGRKVPRLSPRSPSLSGWNPERWADADLALPLGPFPLEPGTASHILEAT